MQASGNPVPTDQQVADDFLRRSSPAEWQAGDGQKRMDISSKLATKVKELQVVQWLTTGSLVQAPTGQAAGEVCRGAGLVHCQQVFIIAC